jgi:hypothetical protein
VVVGWGTDYVLVASLDDQQMTILDAGIEVNTLVGEVFVEVVDERCSLLSFEATAGMILEEVTLDADKVATQG